ncbi:alpha/beta fold hydrolase [Noviherbaspirillum aridicola]|uniref:Alpha/beta hydrolase n=1 Tax=Noviherbaspirillum aridicola TaxID=2849687 RepID=A0ABQ4Q6Z7_9BURK|nr:alpha/beta hydrolase [Noviherbaspirillum aridicola]GIZ52811.1 alpha/beta hydrolase [Noviherbaspirillum aridicola]
MSVRGAHWIFLRGLTRESRHWGGFPEQFRAALGPVPVHMLDLPGNGARHAERSPASVTAMVEDCRRQAAAAGIPSPFFVLGLSMGGMIAAAWARAHPAQLRGCVMINSSIGSLSPLHHRLRWRAWPMLLRLAAARGDAAAIERGIWALTSRRAPHAPELDRWTALRLARPVSAGNTLRQLLASSRFRPDGKPRAPLLVLASRGDGLVSPDCSRRLAAAWGASLALHPWAGHDLPLDDGDWVAREVNEWLRGSFEREQTEAETPRMV